MDRVILHVDANSYFANVEILHEPKLRGKPVVVGGDVELRHGVVLAKSQETKRYGIKTGEALWQARSKCPGLVVIPPHYDLYARFCLDIRSIFAEYTDQVEPFGIDEAWLDVTGSQALFGNGETIANDIRERVKRELGLTVSVGVSFNKIFAKMGSDMKKPDAVTVIERERFKQIVWPLPVQEMMCVGQATRLKLNTRGIVSIGQLAAQKPGILHSWFGKMGHMLWYFANGEDVSPVKDIGYEDPIKSVGNSFTAPRDIVTAQDASIIYRCLSESVATRLREQGIKGGTIQVYLRGTDLRSIVRQLKLRKPTFISGEIHGVAMHLLNANWDFSKPLRTIGVSARGLVSASTGVQLDFFEDEETRMRKEALETAIDRIRGRFGYSAISRAVTHLDKQLGSIDAKADHTVYPISYFR